MSDVRCQKACARVALVCLLLCALCLLSFSSAEAQYGRPPESRMPKGGKPDVLKEIGIDQRLNEQVPLDLSFRDETGRAVRLGEYFREGKPVLLSLVYYECPMLCNMVLNEEVGMMRALPFTAGREFTAVTVSFDARETPELAARKRETYLKRYGQGQDAGWHFLTGDEANIRRLTDAVGFHFKWDEQSKQFAHASAIMVLTPKGKISHYFYGVEYAPKDVRLGLVEASEGKIGSPVEKLMLYCYHYDPATGKYGPAVMNIVKVSGLATLVAIISLVVVLRRRERVGRQDRDVWGEGVDVGGNA